MTTSKCFKFLLNSSLLTAAIWAAGSLSAHAEQNPQSAQTCTLTLFSETTYSNCDQGGCWGPQNESIVTLTQDGSEKTLYEDSNPKLPSELLVKELQKQFADQCDVITIKEESPPIWHHGA